MQKKKSLGPHSECNVKKKVAYVLCFRDPKSLRPHSGDRSFCVFAYLIALLAPRNSTLQYLIALLQPRNSKSLWKDFGRLWGDKEKDVCPSCWLGSANGWADSRTHHPRGPVVPVAVRCFIHPYTPESEDPEDAQRDFRTSKVEVCAR